MKFVLLSSIVTTVLSMKASHPVAKDLLSKARRVEQDQEDAYSWIIDYSIQFASCHVVDAYNFEDEDSGVAKTSLVKFKLCPTNKCGYGCKGAEYLVPMDEFVNSYTEWEMNDLEYKCEQIRENCDCEYYNDDDVCEANCYSKAGMYESCVEAENGDDDTYEFNLQEWLECTEIEAENGYYSYYVGPKCSSNGEKITLGVFSDEYCTQSADKSIFKSAYGISLPYSSQNIVSEACLSCSSSNANNDGYYYDNEITEICEESYRTAAKCESNLANSIAYPDTSGCDYMTNIAKFTDGYVAPSQSFAVTMAVLFGLTTLALGLYAGKLHMETKKRQINLSDDTAVV